MHILRAQNTDGNLVKEEVLKPIETPPIKDYGGKNKVQAVFGKD